MASPSATERYSSHAMVKNSQSQSPEGDKNLPIIKVNKLNNTEKKNIGPKSARHTNQLDLKEAIGKEMNSFNINSSINIRRISNTSSN